MKRETAKVLVGNLTDEQLREVVELFKADVSTEVFTHYANGGELALLDESGELYCVIERLTEVAFDSTLVTYRIKKPKIKVFGVEVEANPPESVLNVIETDFFTIGFSLGKWKVDNFVVDPHPLGLTADCLNKGLIWLDESDAQAVVDTLNESMEVDCD